MMLQIRPDGVAHFTPLRVAHNVPESLAHFVPVEVVHYAPVCSFAKALAGFVGVNYMPNTVSTQVVEGKNYRYKCQASLPGSEGMWDAIVEIFQPLDSDPYIYGIIRI